MLDGDEKLFKTVVKTAFNQRRKTMRNSLKSLLGATVLPEKFSGERPEQCSVEDFIELTNLIEVLIECMQIRYKKTVIRLKYCQKIKIALRDLFR